MQIVEGIYLPDDDLHFREEIRKNPMVDGKGTYQFAKLRAALEEEPGRRNIAIDVGAHVGLWTRILAKEFKRVIAVEPTQEHVTCLIQNVRLDLYSERVSIWQFPLADEVKNISIKRSREAATAQVCVGDEVGDFSLMAMPLDKFCLEGVDFIKLDCEGFEYFILKGAEETIRRDKPVVVVEQKKKRIRRYGLDDQPAVDLLKSWGAQEIWSMSGDHCLRWM